MNGFEYKKRYDPELGRYVKKNIYSGEIQEGGGLTDIFKSTIKKAVKRGLQKVARKTGEHVSKKSGDKITQLLRRKNDPIQASQPSPVFLPSQPSPNPQMPMSQDEINERVNRLISGGKFRKINF